MVPFAKPSFLSCVTGFPAVLNTDLSPVGTGCLPCDKLIGINVAYSISAAEPPQKKKSIRIFRVYFVSGRWLRSRLRIPH